MSTDEAPDDALLRRYLLGLTSAEESERLDELTVTSADLASRLQAVEYDLVDAFTAGELSGEMLTGFKSTYPTYAEGRAEIDFAQALMDYQARKAAVTKPQGLSPARVRPRLVPHAGPRAVQQPDGAQPADGGRTSEAVGQPQAQRAAQRPGRLEPFWQRWTLPRWTLPPWPVAVAATLAVAVAGFLLAENQSLRHAVESVRSDRTTLEDRTRALQQQLDAQRLSDAERAKELARLRASIAAHPPLAPGVTTERPAGIPPAFVAFVLPPAGRGTEEITTIAVPRQAASVGLELPMDDAPFPSFNVALRDASSNRIIWHAEGLHSTTNRDGRALAMTVEAGLLKPGTYLIEPRGTRPNGRSELLSLYTFRVVIP